jgi:hypothetical protein
LADLKLSSFCISMVSVTSNADSISIFLVSGIQIARLMSYCFVTGSKGCHSASSGSKTHEVKNLPSLLNNLRSGGQCPPDYKA